MDVNQNDDFYVILHGTPPYKYHVSWDKEPLVLDQLRKWRVAMTEFSYYHIPWSALKNYKFTTHSKCYTHINILMKSINIDLNSMDVKYDYDPLISSNLYHGNFTLELPKVKLNNKSQLVFHSKYRTDMIFEKDVAGDQTWDADEKLWHTVHTNLIIKEDMKKHGTLKLENVQIKIRSPQYFIRETFALDENMLFSNMDDALTKLNPYFQQSLLTLAKTTNNLFCLKPKETYLLKGSYEEWRNVTSIEFDEGFHHLLGFTKNSGSLADDFEMDAKFPPQFHQAMTYLNVFANICTPYRVGKDKMQLLRTLYLSESNRGPRTIPIANPMYLPVDSTEIKNIDVNIQLPNGSTAPLDENTWNAITLHFKTF